VVKKTINKHPIGWTIAVFILAIIVAIFALVNTAMSNTFLLLGIFLMTAATFLKMH